MPYPPVPHVILTVSALSTLLRSHVEAGFSDVWVEGEVSNLRMPSSGHAYFTLKDATSQIRSVMFRSVGRFLRFHLKDGMCVICRGRLTVYEPKGDYQLVVAYAEPKGVGALQVAFEQLKERLAADGLFDAGRKRPLPAFPQRLGIITSPTGAAIRDIIQVAHRRWPNIELLLNPVGVQGIGAAAEIAKAIAEMNELGGLDVLIVGRGGGSLEDLWAFNEEVVARALAASRIPVVSAVGHEIDYTIADFVADLRAPTPSAAVELVLPARSEIIKRFSGYGQQTVQAIRGRLRDCRSRVETERRALLDPAALVQRAMQRRDELEMRLCLAEMSRMRESRQELNGLRQGLLLGSPIRRIEQGFAMLARVSTQLEQRVRAIGTGWRHALEQGAGALHALSPLAILARGYSITRRWPEMRLLRNAADVAPGETVHVRLSSGELICEVRRLGEELQPGES
ncbi:MAG TPA: exodeoxyribonuclease VII large subunit [Nitrospirales bacterium]|jgi:exodeoxyribonuclease VII large subunit